MNESAAADHPAAGAASGPRAGHGGERETRHELSYEQARAELATVVERLEAGGSTLEESLTLWERGEELADICQRWLDGARKRLDDAQQTRAD
jgi:exodeoxyribonuclease VII small subunit